MSFITRCPDCATAFKVLPDQLKISDGWVRCGQCQHIFDATLDLQPWWPGQEQASAPRQPTVPEPQRDPEPMPAPAATPEPSPEPLVPERPEAMPSFMRQAQRRAFWQRPLLRLLLALLALTLAALLGLQAAYQWRAPVLRELPALQPVLDAMCQTLDCQQGLPSGLNQVVIDSSVLLRRAPGLYAFNVVLRNQSALELASPAIELTLTDIHDQVLVRRVLLPYEWPRPTAMLAAGGEWSLQFELAFDGIEGRIMTGYRAILFYP